MSVGQSYLYWFLGHTSRLTFVSSHFTKTSFFFFLHIRVGELCWVCMTLFCSFPKDFPPYVDCKWRKKVISFGVLHFVPSCSLSSHPIPLPRLTTARQPCLLCLIPPIHPHALFTLFFHFTFLFRLTAGCPWKFVTPCLPLTSSRFVFSPFYCSFH